MDALTLYHYIKKKKSRGSLERCSGCCSEALFSVLDPLFWYKRPEQGRNRNRSGKEYRKNKGLEFFVPNEVHVLVFLLEWLSKPFVLQVPAHGRLGKTPFGTSGTRAPTDHRVTVLSLGFSDVPTKHFTQNSRHAWMFELASFSPAIVLLRQFTLLNAAFTQPSRTASNVAPDSDTSFHLDAKQIIWEPAYPPKQATTSALDLKSAMRTFLPFAANAQSLLQLRSPLGGGAVNSPSLQEDPLLLSLPREKARGNYQFSRLGFCLADDTDQLLV